MAISERESKEIEIHRQKRQAERSLRLTFEQLDQLVEQCLTELTCVQQALLLESAARQQAEQALFQLTAIIQASTDAIVSTDCEGRILSWNPGAERLYGYTTGEAVGQSWLTLVEPDTPNVSFAPIATTPHPVTHRHKSGEWITVRLTLSPIQDTAGAVIGWSMIATDIGDRQELEQLKDELIGIVNHEFRTPLTALKGASELLLTHAFGDLSEAGQRMLSIVARNTERLVQLTNHVFDLNQLTAHHLVLDRQPCNLADLMHQAAKTMQNDAAMAGVELCVTPVAVPLTVDACRICQVLTNLLSNAIKFSSPGDRVWIGATVNVANDCPRAIATAHVLIHIKDEGEGIPADQLESIFDKFQLVDASDARRHGGAGLGLAVSQGIVQRHHGKLWGESQLGEGCTFYLALPITQDCATDSHTV